MKAMRISQHLSGLSYGFVAFLLLAAGSVTFIGNWLGSLYGGEMYIKAVKDVALYGLLAVLFIFLAVRRRAQLWGVLRRPYNILIVLYALVHGAYVLLFNVDQTAEFAGLNFNLRFLALFIFMQLILLLPQQKSYVLLLQKVIVGLGIFLASIALLQVFVLPKDILSNFGYELDNGLSYYTIDNDPTTLRANATTRGPNELGAFLLIPILLLAAKWLWSNQHRNKKIAAAIIVMTLGLLVTFSRSAFLGLLLGLLVLVGAWALHTRAHIFTKKRVAITLGALVAVIGAGAVLLVSSPRVQQVVLHTSLDEISEDGSDFERVRQQARAATWVVEQPEGYGLGTAGPSSFYNPNGVNITENYYLQIAIEVGVIGVALFFAIVYFLLRELLTSRNPFADSLLASFVALSFVSLLLHGWADDLTSYTWWGLAGLYVARHNHEHDRLAL